MRLSIVFFNNFTIFCTVPIRRTCRLLFSVLHHKISQSFRFCKDEPLRFLLIYATITKTTVITRGGHQMGFLDSLLKKTVSKVVSETANSVANTINNSLSQAVGGSASSAGASSAKKNNDGMLPGYEHLRNAMVEEKLDAVLAKEFPQYTVEREVSATTFGGLDTYMPYSYVIYDEARNPKLIIMIVSRNTCASAAYKRSRELSEANGFTLINFVAAFENRMDYIVNRLHQYL